jgi:hypothetical protein
LACEDVTFSVIKQIIFFSLFLDEPPPSYDSLYGKIKRAKADSDSNVGFARTVATLLFASGKSLKIFIKYVIESRYACICGNSVAYLYTVFLPQCVVIDRPNTNEPPSSHRN